MGVSITKVADGIVDVEFVDRAAKSITVRLNGDLEGVIDSLLNVTLGLEDESETELSVEVRK